MRTIFEHLAALLMTVAGVIFVLAILIVMNRFMLGQMLSCDAPLPCGLILAVSGLGVVFAARCMQRDNPD